MTPRAWLLNALLWVFAALAVFPLVGLAMALRPVGYSVFVAFLTPSFVLVADYVISSFFV